MEPRLAEEPAQGHVANGSASISRETWLAALDKARLAGVGRASAARKWKAIRKAASCCGQRLASWRTCRDS